MKASKLILLMFPKQLETYKVKTVTNLHISNRPYTSEQLGKKNIYELFVCSKVLATNF